jgi:hypothetical protein
MRWPFGNLPSRWSPHRIQIDQPRQEPIPQAVQLAHSNTPIWWTSLFVEVIYRLQLGSIATADVDHVQEDAHERVHDGNQCDGAR